MIVAGGDDRRRGRATSDFGAVADALRDALAARVDAPDQTDCGALCSRSDSRSLIFNKALEVPVDTLEDRIIHILTNE